MRRRAGTIRKVAWDCRRGPFNGFRLFLEYRGDGNTLIFTYKGQTGQYRNGTWWPHENNTNTGIDPGEHLFLRRLHNTN